MSRFWIALVSIAAVLLCVGGLLVLRALQQPSLIVVAFANSLTGPIAAFGEEARIATQIYFDQINAAGGIEGHLIQLRMFDDQSKPVIAGINVPAILRSPALAVLGHSVSATSVVAGPRYKAGHIAAVAGNASSDELTEDNPFYFEALSPNSVQASFLADYIRIVVQGGDQRSTTSPVVDFVTNETTYGRSFRDGFARNVQGEFQSA